MLIKELPLALNPTGCIRSERFHKHHVVRYSLQLVTTLKSFPKILNPPPPQNVFQSVIYIYFPS